MNINKRTLTGSNWPVWLVLTLIIAFVLIVRLQFIHIPFERDEGTYCYMGQLVLDGKVSYLDFYEMKPPVLFYSYAAIIFLFGKTVEAVHAAFILLNIFTLIFLFLIGKKLLGRNAGLVAAASYAILSLCPYISGFTVQSEHIISFFVTAGVLVMLEAFERKNDFYLFCSGLLLGAAVLVKQNGLFFIAFAGSIIVIYNLIKKPPNKSQLIKWMAWFSAGVTVVLILVVSILYFQGALKAAIFWTYSYARGYVSTFTTHDSLFGIKDFINTLGRTFLVWLISGAILILPLLFQNKKLPAFSRWFVFLFLVFSFLAVTPGLRFYGHYFIFFMPAVSLLAAAGVVSIKNMLLKYYPERYAARASMAIFAAIIFMNILSQKEYYFNHDDTGLLRTVYEGSPFPEAKVVGDYIRKNSTENDSIAVFGSEPEIYFYADRRCPSKYCDCTALISSNTYAPLFQKEFERDMEASVPKYFVVFKNRSSAPAAGADTSVFNWLNSFLAANYHPVCKIDMISPNDTRYVWGKEANNYKMQSCLNGSVFERLDRIEQTYNRSTKETGRKFEAHQISRATTPGPF